MARTPLPVTGASKAGVDAGWWETADTVNGNSVHNSGGQTLLLVNNTGTTHRTLTVQVAATVDGLAVNPRILTVPANSQMICGPYEYGWYGTTLLLDAEHPDLRLAAIRLAGSLPVAVPAGPFSTAGPVVRGNLDAAGLSPAGNVLVVDTTVTASTVDGDVLVVAA